MDHAPQIALLQSYPFSILPRYLKGMLTYLNEYPYFSTNGPIFVRTQEELKRIVPNIDGIIAPLFNQETLVEMLSWRKPIVGICNTIDQSEIATVSFNDNAIGRTAAEYFINQSYPHYSALGYVNTIFSEERTKGYQNTLKSHGIYLEPTYNSPSNYLSRKLNHRIEWLEWLKNLRKPCAIFCINDALAIELLLTCRKNGINVPEEIAILGSDNDLILQEIYSTQISSIDPNVERIGWESCRVLKDILSQQINNVAFKFRIPPKEVIERGTSERHPQSDSYVDHALEIIRDNIGTDFNVNDLVVQLPLSRRALERKFQKQVKRTPKQEILYQRMNKACHFLENTDLPLNEIATQLGFDEQRKLTRQFKQFSGITPLTYRNSSKKTTSPSKGGAQT